MDHVTWRGIKTRFTDDQQRLFCSKASALKFLYIPREGGVICAIGNGHYHYAKSPVGKKRDVDDFVDANASEFNAFQY
jgi:hypothetical protein